MTQPDPREPTQATPGGDDDAGVLRSSAVMAAGTVFSRLSGFLRSTLLAAALGLSLHRDVFEIANTVPTMLYILLAGGMFNAVLVPQLVRSMKRDPDGGEAYANRIVTLAALFLGAVTVLLVVAAPWVMSIFLDASWSDPALAEQRQSLIDFARFCLPQVFFYGMFVLVGQILNSRGRFGPMMWAPIANNFVAIGVLVAYLLAFGPASEGARGPYDSTQEIVLGVGSTLGIVAQFVILLPYLRAAGFHIRPRFDFRGTGLGHTLRLGSWTVLFVLVNQLAYTVVVRLASGGTTGAGDDGTGYAIYTSALLITMVPHSVITVSLVTAILPAMSRRAADDDYAGVGRMVTSTQRTVLAVVVPFAALLPVVATDVANVVWGHGAASETYRNAVPTLSLFGAGLVFFSVHYLMLRGFYALEQTRTVFFIQCAVAAVNIGAAVLLVGLTGDKWTAPALVMAYTCAYVVGSAISYVVLARRLGGMPPSDRGGFVGWVGRLLLATFGATAPTVGLALLVHSWSDDPHWLVSAVQGGALAVFDALVFVVLARVLRITEVTSVLATIGAKLPRRGGRRN